MDRINLMESSIHQAITEAVSELCNCSFSGKFLRKGKFRCWNSPSQVTYRSSVVGTASLKSSQILAHIEGWVRSQVAEVDVGQMSLQVLSSSECAVGLSSLTEAECEGRSSLTTLTLVTQDVGAILCVQNCVNSTSGN